jgi:hypothetical protein
MIHRTTVTIEIWKTETMFIDEKINEFKENRRLNEKEADIKMKQFYQTDKIHLNLMSIFTTGYYINQMNFIEKYFKESHKDKSSLENLKID